MKTMTIARRANDGARARDAEAARRRGFRIATRSPGAPPPGGGGADDAAGSRRGDDDARVCGDDGADGD